MRTLNLQDERSLSACLFGHRHRAELLTALASAVEGRVNLGVLADERGVSAAVYYPPMRELVAAGLAEPVDVAGLARRRWYARRGDPALWEAWAALSTLLAGHFQAQRGPAGTAGPGYEKVGA